MFNKKFLLICLTSLFFTQSGAEELDESWLNDDSEQRAAEVNEGELRFLAPIINKPVHHHQNIIILDHKSKQTGWVTLQQCHRNLDRVSVAQIVYRKQRIKNLRIISYKNIESAQVEDNSVQLKNIRSNSELCLQARSQAFHKIDATHYVLKNGPFMRQFLDGFYPMHVSIEVRYVDTGLKYSHIQPRTQAGFEVKHSAHKLALDTWFEGRLFTEFHFTKP